MPSGLILCRAATPALRRKFEATVALFRPHLGRVALALPEDEALTAGRKPLRAMLNS